jgi:hypothetical protein
MWKMFLVVLVSLLAWACTSYTAAPNSRAITSVPAFDLRAFKGRSLSVVAQDLRADPADSERLCKEIVQDLTQALTRAGATVTQSSPSRLTVKVTRLRADVSGRQQWEGCASMNVNIELEGVNPQTLRVDRCSPTSAWAGLRPDQAAINKAYADALVDLLAQLDALAP